MARSQDGGHGWEEIAGTPFEGYSVLGLAVLPDDPQTVYAATAVGLYLSRDGGDSWQRLEALEEAATRLPPGLNEPPPGGGFIVFDVVLDPFNPQVIYAATQQYALWRSDDGGQTWTQAAAGMDPNEPLFDLEPDLSHQGVLYASSCWSGVFVTTDGGQSWRRLADGLGFNNITDLALTEDGSVLYAGSSGSGVFRLGRP
jgi:photosystem II stability/assembly factor-like uncharacterized protein